ncbi:mechanosensitive ion channel family protein [Georgenia sp. AZ-5]|uniref:mechanosensitive ion channel family protein n=1 Tax=Georgenia sp. AZ-5 TaxID=3367526 RepID=UPI0037545E7B
MTSDSLEDTVSDTLDDTLQVTVDLLTLVLWVAGGVVAALLLSYVITGIARVINRRRPVVGIISRRGRRPFQAILVIVGAWTGLVLAVPVPQGIREPAWRSLATHGLLIALIVACTWFVAAMVRVVEDIALAHVKESGSNSRARRVQTQAQVLRRVGVVVVVVLGIAATLLTFPGMRAAGASILASAGILSVVAGLAAQTTLGNVFAGLQLAMTDAIRVDDVVIVEGQFGHIEEITLTYVVVRLWDDRRMIMPSTYFTSTPFENWTRQAPALLGTVEFDVDWRVPVPAMRAELERLLRHTDLWDERVGILQVERATGGGLQVRALVSGKDAPTLTDLKYYLRENLVDWLQTVAPYALPRTRYEPQEVVELTDRRTDPMYKELREEIHELAELDGAAEAEAEPDTLLIPAGSEDPERRREREASARRARRRAEREDKRRLRSGEGLGRRAERRSRGSVDQTELLELGALDGADGTPERTRSHAQHGAGADATAQGRAVADAQGGDDARRPAPAPAGPEETGVIEVGAATPVVRDGASPAEGHPGTRRTSMRKRAARAERETTGTAVLHPTATTATTSAAGHEASMFTGSPQAEERAQAFSGPGEEAMEERELEAERKRAAEDSRRARELQGKDATPEDSGGGDGGDGGD